MRGWVVKYGDLHIQVAEYGRAIHCKATYSEPLPGGGAEAGNAGSQEVVVEGGTVILMPRGGGIGG